MVKNLKTAVIADAEYTEEKSLQQEENTAKAERAEEESNDLNLSESFDKSEDLDCSLVDDYIRNEMQKVSKENDSAKLPSIYQSWQLTKMKYSFSRLEKNIFLKIIEVAQKYLNKEYLGKDCDFSLNKEFGKEQPSIEFPIKDLLKKSHNYKYVKDSLQSLLSKNFGIPKNESWDFDMVNLFTRVQASQKRGIAKVTISNEFWKAFYNLKVFKEIDPNLAYNFKSIYTVRIYELIVGNRVAVTYDIKNLISMFCVEKTYKTTGEFIKYVIQVAQKEMKGMEECPFYFSYDLVYKSRKIDKIVFQVIFKEEKEPEKLEQVIVNMKMELSQEIVDSVKKLFRTEIREDLENKLIKVQNLIGEKNLANKIGFVYKKAKELKEKKELRASYAAYLSGALDRIYSDALMENQVQKQLKRVATDVKPVEEKPISDGYVYYTLKELEKKSKMSGFDSVEEFLKSFPMLEDMGNGKWRMKE